ncbi:MAG: leucine-rich repeat protein [Huintestinicola sp.]|uniref:leucine-rich repeat protein n=1 Tax=Huintestinicola sp. TaxID=2981661 RepID=UPI003F03531F
MYKKISVIHRSRQSTVWLCETEDGGRAVCKELCSDPKVYEKLKAAGCEYIPKIYEIDPSPGNDGGQQPLEIFEEYIEGKTLQELSLSYKEAVNAAVQLCRAVDGLHSLGIIHRDIKPSNIMLDKNGRLKIVDLSSARLFKEEMDKDTVCLGTEGFAAPEQYGYAQTDFRTDVFAVGQTLRLIFENREHFPVGYIISRSTSFDPDKRFKSCRQIEFLLKFAQPGKIGAVSGAAAVIAAAAFCILRSGDGEKLPEVIAAEDFETVTSVSESISVTSDSHITSETSAAAAPENNIDPDHDYGIEELRLSLEAEYAHSDEGYTGINSGYIFKYDVYDDHVVITGYDGDNTEELIIPDEIEGLPVTEIEMVYVPEDTTRLVIPDSVKIIQPGAFCGCSALETVDLGANVEYIGKEAFINCENLRTVNMGEKVRYIGDRCFAGDARLEKIIMPDTVEYLGEGAFMLCNLRYFNIPAGVRVIKPYTFNGKPYSEDDGPYMVYIDPNVEEDYSTKEKTIPSTVKKIEHDAFSGIRSLEKVTVSEGVEVVSASAFHNCPMQDYVWVNETKARRECIFKLYLPESTVMTDNTEDMDYEVIRY